MMGAIYSMFHPVSIPLNSAKDGFTSDKDEIEFGCHLLPHFNLDTNANTDLRRYKYKTDCSNPDTLSI